MNIAGSLSIGLIGGATVTITPTPPVGNTSHILTLSANTITTLAGDKLKTEQ